MQEQYGFALPLIGVMQAYARRIQVVTLDTVGDDADRGETGSDQDQECADDKPVQG
jgi:hypothetical protein